MEERITSLEVSAICSVGMVRQRNEDIAIIDGELVRDGAATQTIALDAAEAHFFAVADGVGGGPGGDVASRMVGTEIGERLLAIPQARPDGKPTDGAAMDGEPTDGAAITSVIQAHCARVNEALLQRARERSELDGMATTLTGIFMYRGRGYALNCGDSRIYRYADGRLAQLSRDHTLRELSGDRRIPGNIIYNCFGGAREFFVDVWEEECPPGGYLLLCSDGLSDMVADAEIARVIREGRPAPADIVARLSDTANANGGHDNITALLIAAR